MVAQAMHRAVDAYFAGLGHLTGDLQIGPALG
jgi:hypothetical protein